MATVDRNVQYLNRDFSDIRTKLIDFSKTYFPNTYNDFSPTSPGMMFIEQASYVNDVLSFYLDNQLQETYTQFARQTNNVYELAYMFGYKPQVSKAATTFVDIYQQVPSFFNGVSYVPDLDYALIVNENTVVNSSTNDDASFLIQDKCDFSINTYQDPTSTTIYQISGEIPLYFLLKKTRKAISAKISTQSYTFTSPTPFSTIEIEDNNILGILDIVDSDGNIWYEVDYLAQEMVYDSISNTNPNDPNNVANVGNVPYLLQLKKVQRRFSTRFTSETTLQIQFGAGNPNDVDETVIPNPNNVGIGLPFEKSKLTTAYSPTNFLFTDTYGISPSNTILTIRYLTGGGVKSNVRSGDISEIDSTNVNFNNINLSDSTSNYVFSTLAVNNEVRANGGQSGDTLEEIKQNTLATIAAQQRSVTLDDYMVRALSMPPEFGSVYRAYIEKPLITDTQISTINTLSLYTISQDSEGHLTTPSPALLSNLRTYLSQYRMIGDSIEVFSAYVINIAIDFEIVVLPNYNNNEVLLLCINFLKSHFSINNWQINEPIIIGPLFVNLDNIPGVQTVKNIKITNKTGTISGYSPIAYDIDSATQNQVIYPSLDPSIFELKYPDTDIKGKVVPL